MTQQSMEALAKANRTRKRLARTKQELKRREIRLTWAMERPCTQGMTIFDLLIALPNVGDKTALKMLSEADMSPYALVAHLSESRRRQLEELVG